MCVCNVNILGTNRINLPNTTPLNGDFDGDEINFYLSRSQHSRSETKELIMSHKQLRSQQGCSIVMGLVQNACVASYLMSSRDRFFTREEFMHLCGQFQTSGYLKATSPIESPEVVKHFLKHVTDGLPEPAIVKPVPKWTGLQLISLFLPRGFYYGDKLDTNIDSVEKEKRVIIRDGEMLWGELTKKEVGPGSNTVPHVILQDFGNDMAKRWMEGWQLVVNMWLEMYGVTVHRGNYQMRDDTFRTKVVNALNKEFLRPENAHYNMALPDECELYLIRAQKRVRELLTKKLEIDITNQACMPNHILSLTSSATKGKLGHIGQLGACLGPQEGEQPGRMPCVNPHYNKTRNLPEAHGFVDTPLERGCRPWPYFCHVKCGRQGLLSTSKNVPRVGYVQRKLAVILSGIHVEHDGTVRDAYGNIFQFRFGDDGMDPSCMEYIPMQFYTPYPAASVYLKSNRDKLMKHLETMYRESEISPRALVGPVQFQRLFGNAKYKLVSDRQKNSDAHVPLKVEECEKLVNMWFDSMGKNRRVLISDNLLLLTFLQDALSTYNLVDQCQFTGRHLADLLAQIEHYIGRSIAPAYESVGTMTAQSLGEPATQSGLNLFHDAGQKSSALSGALIGDASAAALVVSTSSADEQMNECINASKRESHAHMTAPLKFPFNKDYKSVLLACQQLPCRRLLQLIQGTKTYEPGCVDQWPDAWARDYTEIYAPLDPEAPNPLMESLRKFPTMRIEFKSQACEALNLSMEEIFTYLCIHFKRGLYPLFSKKGFVIYLHLDLFKHPQMAKRILSFADKHPELAPLNYSLVIE